MPIKLLALLIICQTALPLTIMLSPFGDAKQTGRIIDDSFERSITLKFAEEAKAEIEKQNKSVQVILNRVPGEILEPLQNANFANRLDADFYLSIHFFKEKGTRPRAFLFSYASDTFHTPIISALTFVPFDEAFRINLNQAKELGTKFEAVLQQEKYKHAFDFKELLKIPFRPLCGVKAPSLAFEASIKSCDDWKHYVAPVVEGVNTVIRSLR